MTDIVKEISNKTYRTLKIDLTLNECIEMEKNLHIPHRLNMAKLEHKDLTEEDIIKEALIGKENIEFRKINETLKEYDKRIEECLNTIKFYAEKYHNHIDGPYKLTKEQNEKISELCKDKRDYSTLYIPKDNSLKSIFPIKISDIIYIKITYKYEEGTRRKILGNLENIDINLIYKDKINIKEEHFFLRELMKMTLDEKSSICNILSGIQKQMNDYYPSKLISVEGDSPTLNPSNLNNNYKIFIGNKYIGQMINNEIFNNLDKSKIDILDEKYYGKIYDNIYDRWDPKENSILNEDEMAVSCFSCPRKIGDANSYFLVRYDKFISLEVIERMVEKTKEKKYLLFFNYFDKAKNSQKLLIECIEYRAKTQEEKEKVEETIRDLQKAIRNIFDNHLIGMTYQLDKNRFYTIDMVVDAIYAFPKNSVDKKITLWGGERVNLTIKKRYLKDVFNTLQKIYMDKKYNDCNITKK